MNARFRAQTDYNLVFNQTLKAKTVIFGADYYFSGRIWCFTSERG